MQGDTRRIDILLLAYRMFFCLTTSLYSGDIFNHSVSFRFVSFLVSLFLGLGSFHVISTQKKPDPLGFLRKLVTIRYLVSDDATPILGSPHQVFLDLWPFLCGQFFTNFADLKCLNTHN